jgi:hypothetical protein
MEMLEQQLEEDEDERRTRRAEPGRPRTPEPMGLGMTHLSDDEDRRLNSPRPSSVIDELFERLTTCRALELVPSTARCCPEHHLRS